MESVEVFDFYRIFIGSRQSFAYLLEVIFRTIIMFSWMLLNIRFLDKRTLGQLTPFEFLITLVLGSSSSNPMYRAEIPILPAMTAVTTIVLLEKLLVAWGQKSRAAKQVTRGEPALLIENGKIIGREHEKQSISREELLERLRGEGIEDVAQVKYAILETSGKLSVISYSGQRKRNVESTITPLQVKVKKR